METFLHLTDLHWGFENRGGHKLPLHDPKALAVALKFAEDFKPDHIILGGDMLDAGCVSHHNHGKPGATEGLRLLQDAKGLKDALIKPLEVLNPKTLTFIEGNHEDWINQLIEKFPALEGILEIQNILSLDSKWKMVPNGGFHKLGKLIFIHGDQISGGEHSAKAAVTAYESNVRFGHFHTYNTYTKTSTIDTKMAKTGVCVPCLCRKDPGYGGGKPNRWAQGFGYGYIDTKNSIFNDYVAIITDGKAIIDGKLYKG